MNLPHPRALHDALLTHPGALLVVRAPTAPPRPAPGQPGVVSDYVQDTPEVFVAVLADEAAPGGWRALAFNGHVDLGTGIRTALAQIVAEELHVPVARLEMVLGHTNATPNQGPTIASASIQISAAPLRRAAAQARERLLARAARQWGVAADTLRLRDGIVRPADAGDERALHYGQLVQGRHTRLELATDDAQVRLKPARDYTAAPSRASTSPPRPPAN
jgi:nicotinate dehydrogenase subunit B